MPSRENLISEFCWGALHHFLGLDERAAKCLEQIRKTTDHDPLIEDLGTMLELMLQFSESSWDREDQRCALLQNLLTVADRILDPERQQPSNLFPNFAKESPRAENYDSAGRMIGKDNIDEGFSRHPYARFPTDETAVYVTLAAVCYLVRAYSHFFRFQKVARQYYVAKGCMNDLYQAYRLLWRTYENCDRVSHHTTGSLEKFVQGVRDPDDRDKSPWESAYFLWAGLLMVEIQEGNIYYHIGYSEAAAKAYDRALKRLSMIWPESGWFRNSATLHCEDSEMFGLFITPTVMRAMFERSKLFFDVGRFLDSMSLQLVVLLAILEHGDPVTSSMQHLKDTVIKGINYLRAEHASSVWDKMRIAATLGYPHCYRQYDGARILVKDFRDLLCNDFGSLAIDVFSRLGFTLFTLTNSSKSFRNSKTDILEYNKWLRTYFRSDKIVGGKASPMGLYCETMFFDDHDTKPTEILFARHPERQFAYRLRQEMQTARLRDSQNIIGLLESITRNVGNMITIPERNNRLLMRLGYKESRSYSWKPSSQSTKANSPSEKPHSKLVILRRWQSYNPKLPHPAGKRRRGGGYLLRWQDKGIAIDPGYDFIQNLYDEGFSLDDIDAIVLSHSHPDHDDDLSTLLTLINEWNDYHRKTCKSDKVKRVDLFLNESGYRKFSTWVHAEKAVIGRIIPLPLVVWDKDSRSPLGKQQANSDDSQVVGPSRGKNVKIDLTGPCGYSMKIEVVPAWHDDVIGSTGAIGFKFHLFKPHIEKCVGIIGYTGDTHAYGLDLHSDNHHKDNVAEQYAECDVTIAHLGDLKLREVESFVNQKSSKFHDLLPLAGILQDIFCEKHNEEDNTEETRIYRVNTDHITREKVVQFLHLLQSLDLVFESLLKCEIQLVFERNGKRINENQSVEEFLSAFMEDRWEKVYYATNQNIPDQLFRLLKDQYKDQYKDQDRDFEEEERNRLAKWLKDRYSELGVDDEKDPEIAREQIVYMLLALLCTASRVSWQYANHLGLYGLKEIAKSQIADNKQGSSRLRLLIVGELPEELASYRHRVARFLNDSLGAKKHHVYTFTGDIGLHIALDTDADNKAISPTLRCNFCNHNNDLVYHGNDYHPPNEIKETMLKRHQSGMIYLCEKHDHFPRIHHKGSENFMSNPTVRVL